MDCATRQYLSRVIRERDSVRELRDEQQRAQLIEEFWPRVGSGRARLLMRAATAEAGKCDLTLLALPRLEEMEAAHRDLADHPDDGNCFKRWCDAFWQVDDLIPAILAKVGEQRPAPVEPEAIAEGESKSRAAEAQGKSNGVPDSPECYVTFTQMAAIVSRGKRTIRRLYDSGDLPTPDVVGKRGKPHEFLWSRVRPALESSFGKLLPEVFPGDRFLK